MSIENILHCRKNIFNNLLEENEKIILMELKIFILIINIVLINGYCLKNVVKKKQDRIKEKIEKDGTILNFIKGEPSDTILKININVNLILINLIRKIKNKFVDKNELCKQMKYYHQMFYENSNS
jgi:hypothetical protein